MCFKLFPFLLWVALLGCAGQVAAQTERTVTGTVRDTLGKSISGASVRLILAKDTIRTATNEDGTFRATITEGRFSLSVSYLGYAPFQETFVFKDGQEEMELPRVILRHASQLLTEVAIEAPVQAVTMKQDTIEYDPRAFTVGHDDRVEDLLRQLPGIEVDADGKVLSEGKPVSFLRMNGKDFFTGDIAEFIKQLPADIFAKLQIVDDYGAEAAFTGVRTGEPRKMLNLVTKPGMDRGTFGNTSATAGTNKRYGAGLSGNYWQSAKQISANGNLNTSNNARGINTANNINASFADNLVKKLNTSFNYGYDNGRGSNSGDTYSETVNTLGTIFNTSSNESENRNSNHSLNAGIQYDAGKAGYISISPSVNFSNNSNGSASRSSQSGVIRQDLESRARSSQASQGFGSSLSFGLRIGKKRRMLSMNLSGNSNRGDNTQDLDDRIGYFNEQGNPIRDSLLHRLVLSKNHSLGGTMSFSYSEPLGKKMSADFSYNLNARRQESALYTDVMTPSGIIRRVDSLSNIGTTLSLTQRISTGLRYTTTKINASAGLGLNPNRVNSEYTGREERVKNTSLNFSPTMNLSYVMSKATSLGANYSGSSLAPQYFQLQPVRDTRNLQNTVIGNPDLKVAFTHRMGISYRHTNVKKGNTINLALNGGITQNQIVNNTLLRKDTLGSLKQETRYENVNGTYNAGANYAYSIPYKIGGKNFMVSLNGNVNYNNMVSLADNVKNYSRGLTFGQSAGSNVSLKNITMAINARYGTSYNAYTLGLQPHTIISTWQFGSTVGVRKKRFSANASATKNITTGYQGIQPNRPLMINASARQQLFKRNSASFNIQVNDLLNQGNMLSRNISGNSIVENRTNYITRYVIMGFSMQLSKFGGNRNRD